MVEYDLLRIISTLAVIVIHVTSMNVPVDFPIMFFNEASRFAVPFFFIISGYMINYYSGSVKFANFYKYRLTKILIPYALWTLVYVGYRFYLGEISQEQLWQTTLNDLAFGTAFVHFYFLYAILQLYILFPLLVMWLKKHETSLLIVSFIISLTCQVLIYLHLAGAIVLPPVPLGYARFFPHWLFYFALGMILAANKAKFTKQIKSINLWVYSLIYVACLAILIVDGNLTNTLDSSIKPSVIMYSLSSFLLMYALALRYRIKLVLRHRPLGYIGQQCLFILLLHPLVVSLFEIFFPDPEILRMSGSVYVLFMFFMVTAISFLAAALVGKWFYAPMLGAIYYKKVDLIALHNKRD